MEKFTVFYTEYIKGIYVTKFDYVETNKENLIENIHEILEIDDGSILYIFDGHCKLTN